MAAGRTVVRCVCGAELGELSDDARGSFWFRCGKCGAAVADFGLGHRVSAGRVLVMQRIDLETGRVLPSEAEVYQDFQRGDRSADRGGRRLEPSILSDALQRKKALARAKENEQCLQ